MFEKTHKKHIFKKINYFYNRLEYVYKCVATKYPVLDNDTKERDLLLEKLTNLTENLKKAIYSYKDELLTFEKLEYKLDECIYAFDALKLDFPIIECFLYNPPLPTGDTVFPLSDVLSSVSAYNRLK